MTKNNFQAFSQILFYVIKYFKLVVVFAAVLIVISGIYRVESHEAAIVLRFGRLTGTTLSEQIKNPGLHFALPFFIDEVIRVPVQTMHERDINTHYIVFGNRIMPDVDMNGYLITGDLNVVLIRASVLYQIVNPVHYAIYHRDTGQLIDGVVSGEMTRLVTQMDIDTVLTGGRAQLSNAILQNVQISLDNLQAGVAIAAVELIGVVPPMETALYFEDVRSAAVYKETMIQRSHESASIMLLEAQAQASAYTQAAISSRHENLSRAHNKMADFFGIYELYAVNPRLIYAGIFRERIAALLAQSGGSIIVPEGSELPIMMFR